jgi:hypothetical protein
MTILRETRYKDRHPAFGPKIRYGLLEEHEAGRFQRRRSVQSGGHVIDALPWVKILGDPVIP